MDNYTLKAQALALGLDITERQLHRLASFGTAEDAARYLDFIASDALNAEAVRINQASYKRVKRLKSRISEMIATKRAIFLTLTFNDVTLTTTSVDTRRKAVCRFLKDQGVQYVANIDYGAQNGREHYHAVIVPKLQAVDGSSWRVHGAINFERVRVKASSTPRLSKYVDKLTNHAIKETTKRCTIIYSR